MSRTARILFTGAILLGLGLPRSAVTQQVIGHLDLLPPEAGLNPLGVEAVFVDPVNPDVFVLSARGITVMRRGTAPGFVNLTLGAKTASVPADAVLDPVGRRLLVADSGLRSVVAVDGATAAIVARIPLPFAASRLAFDPVQRLVYAVEGGGTGVAVIEASSLNLLGSAALPGPATAAAANTANADLFVTSNARGELYRLDRHLDLVAVVPTGARSSRLVVDPAASRVYVARQDGNVAVVDAASNALLNTIPVSGAQRIALDPPSGNVYVIGDSPQLTRIDPAGATAAVAVATSPNATSATSLEVDAAGRRLFVGDTVRLSAGRISVFDISGATPTRTGGGLTGQTGATDLAFSPVTGRIYVPNGLTTTVSEFDPQGLSGVAIAVGVRIDAGVMNDAGGVGFLLDGARDQAVAVDVAAGRLLRTTAVGALPFRAAIVESLDEVYVVNQNGRSLSVLDASSGALRRSVPGLPNDVTGGIAFDRTVAGGPKGYLSNPSFSAAIPARDYLQSYEPAAGDRLSPLNGNCFTTPCIVPIALGVNETSHRLYVSAVVVGVSVEPRLVIYDTTTDRYVGDVAYPNPGPLPSLFLAVDAATSQVYLPVLDVTGPRVVAVKDGANPQAQDVATAGTPRAFALRRGSLFVAEPDAGAVEEVSTATNRVIATLAAGGAPTALHAQAGNNLLWVANDGLQPPAVQVFGGAAPVGLSDLGFFGYQTAFVGQSSGRVLFANNLHGSVAILDPQPPVADLQIAPARLPDGTTGEPYPATSLGHSDGVGPFTWEVTSGQLPPGLALDPSTGVISGTPGAEGAWSFMVRLTDRGRPAPFPQDMEDFQIQVLDLRFVTLALPAATACLPFSVTLLGAGGAPPYTFSASGLPPWATLDPLTGTITAAPTAPSTCPPAVNFTITDSLGSSRSTSLCLEVRGAVPPPPIGNSVLAAKRDPDLELTWQYPQPVAGANVYRSSDRGQSWARTPAGGPLPPSTTTADYRDPDALSPPPDVWWYQVKTVDLCGSESSR